MPLSLESLALDRRFAGWALRPGGAGPGRLRPRRRDYPEPFFGRQIPPEPFAIMLWLASAPLMGIVGATYTSPARATMRMAARPLGTQNYPEERTTSTLGAVGSLGVFLAIGCPVCNKIALLLLGASGAMTIYATVPAAPRRGIPHTPGRHHRLAISGFAPGARAVPPEASDRHADPPRRLDARSIVRICQADPASERAVGHVVGRWLTAALCRRSLGRGERRASGPSRRAQSQGRWPRSIRPPRARARGPRLLRRCQRRPR